MADKTILQLEEEFTHKLKEYGAWFELYGGRESSKGKEYGSNMAVMFPSRLPLPGAAIQEVKVLIEQYYAPVLRIKVEHNFTRFGSLESALWRQIIFIFEEA